MQRFFLFSFATLFISTLCLADTIQLKNGRTVEGTFIGREGDSIEFDADGITMTFKAEDVEAIDMGAAGSPAASSETAEKTSNGSSAIVPAGTQLTVRLVDSLNSGQHSRGHKFTGSLEGALSVDGTTVAPAGSAVYGEVTEAKKSGRVAGKASLVITITGVKLDGVIVPISTSSINALTLPTGASSAGKVARGAAVGALADGSSGARTGAKVGAGVAVLSGGNQVVIPPGTLIDFQLTKALSVR
ncbi:hypothetical protein [Marinobacter sp. 2_MG-2023]|uniref:hypothetical protein n=1 Tax=Marinobacter sp. 2_MG-2023 TaxID=3062679 RepID=UPI0026E43BD1|nr:hypothetical protein [Marinobacter sp. 2_MG-2023]MDO6442298.1 hypothetical protein [Marinobacter sp. 2_MG-2023]